MPLDPEIVAEVDRLTKTWIDELVAFRRDLHMHPEPGREEVRTTSLVAERLEAAGLRPTLLPVGTLADVMAMLALVLPDPGTPQPAVVFGAGLNGLDSDGGFVTTPQRARWLAPLGWRRNGFAATDTALLLRSGRWWRQLVVVPHQRTQSIALHQGPLARRFRVADLVLHTTPGPVVPRLAQAAADIAEDRERR